MHWPEIGDVTGATIDRIDFTRDPYRLLVHSKAAFLECQASQRILLLPRRGVDLILDVPVKKSVPRAHLVYLVGLIELDVARRAEDHLVERPERHEKNQAEKAPIDIIEGVRGPAIVKNIVLVSIEGPDMMDHLE